jgi:hypothetical protein
MKKKNFVKKYLTLIDVMLQQKYSYCTILIFFSLKKVPKKL